MPRVRRLFELLLAVLGQGFCGRVHVHPPVRVVPKPCRGASGVPLASATAHRTNVAESASASASASVVPQRRQVFGSTLSAVASILSLGGMADGAGAESMMDTVIREARKDAAERAKVKSIFNPKSYMQSSGKYSTKELQEFLPTLFVVKRQYEKVLEQFLSDAVDKSDTLVYELLREQNRIEPISTWRKDLYRAKLWLQENTKSKEEADVKYERLKRAIDDEDSQLLVVSRIEGTIEASASRQTTRSIRDLLDALDIFLELVPADEATVATAVAETKGLGRLALDDIQVIKARRKAKAKQLEEASQGKPAAEAPKEDSAPSKAGVGESNIM